jgi:hypothetical protein
MSKYFLLIIISFFTSHLFAQSLTEKEYEKYPYWVSMINDSTTNYFEAEKAFNTWWSIRPLPVEEDQILGNPEAFNKKEGFFDRMFTTKKEKLEAESQEYAFKYKAFKQWQLRMAPWVQPDGLILSPSKRLRIWEQEQKKRDNN